MYGWIRCFLHDRSARVKLDGHLSKSVKMRERVPLGGVISPTLFLLYISISTVLSRHVPDTLHADDLAVWSASEYTTSSAYIIQEAVNKVEQWTNDWGLQMSEVKTQATVFSLSTSKEKVAIKLGDKTLPKVDSHLSPGKAWHPTRMEATHSRHGEKRHQEACCPEEIVWNTLGCQLKDSKKPSTWEQSDNLWSIGPVPGWQQPRHTPTKWTKFRTTAWGQSSVPWKPLP